MKWRSRKYVYPRLKFIWRRPIQCITCELNVWLENVRQERLYYQCRSCHIREKLGAQLTITKLRPTYVQDKDVLTAATFNQIIKKVFKT